MIELSIITINFNGVADTCALIDTIPYHEETLEVIVVDNASTNDEASIIEQRYPRVRVIRSSQNLGFAGGNNLGLNAARGRYLYFVNNDTVLFRKEKGEEGGMHLFQPLIDRLNSNPDIGLVCPKIRFAWGDNPIQYAGYTPLTKVTMRNSAIGYGESDHHQYDAPHPTPYAHGAAMMARRDALEKAGSMPECYFLYYEELDWSMLFRRAGYEIWYEPAATIYHKESQTTGQGSPLRTYYITRNRFLFARRNIAAPRRWLTYAYLILLVLPRDLVKHLLKRQPRQARAAVRGISDFLRGRKGFRSKNL